MRWILAFAGMTRLAVTICVLLVTIKANCKSTTLTGNEYIQGEQSGNKNYWGNQMGSRNTLLVVDDEASVLKALKRSLKKSSNYIILTANNAEEGLKLLEKNCIAVILSDQRMPKMQGDEFLTLVKEKYPNTIRLMLSGYADFSAVTKALNHGSISKFISKPWDDEELNEIINKAFEQYAINYHSIYNHSYYQTHDPLTQLPNRILVYENLDMAINNIDEKGGCLCTILIDINNFSRINEALGIEKGDQVIQGVADRLRNIAEKVSIIARMEGDKFCILIPDVNESSNIKFIASDILNTLAKPFNINDKTLYVTYNAGISIYPDHAYSSQSLIQCAETALHKSKDLGRNQYYIYKYELNESMKKYQEIIVESELYNAFESNQFKLLYQPIYDMKSKVIVGFESLLRWDHPEHGLILPDLFIPALEKTGLIIPVGEWTIKTAMRQISKWFDAGFREMKITINLTPLELLNSNLLVTLNNYWDELQLHPSFIIFEATGHTIAHNKINNINLLKRIRSRGYKTALDNYSEITCLLDNNNNNCFDFVKISKEVISNLSKNRKYEKIVRNIINTARHMNIKVIATGIDNNEQLKVLEKLHCDFAQGILLSKPLSGKESLAILIKNKTKLSKYDELPVT